MATRKITRKARATVIAIMSDSSKYDADTVVIHRDGTVSAEMDANKLLRHVPGRYIVGHVTDMVDADGNRREGW